jgi:hypothetical protein
MTEPALTPDEWAEQRYRDDEYGEGVGILRGTLCTVYDSGEGRFPMDAGKVLALANHALPDGHPLKITRDDVLWLERVISLEMYENPRLAEHINTLRIKLAALLPPEP